MNAEFGKKNSPQHLVILEREAIRDGALLPPSEHVVEVVGGRQGAVQVLGVGRLLGEAGAVIRHEGRQHRVARREGVDALQAQLLDQAVLQGLVGAFHTALGLPGCWRK